MGRLDDKVAVITGPRLSTAWSFQWMVDFRLIQAFNGEFPDIQFSLYIIGSHVMFRV